MPALQIYLAGQISKGPTPYTPEELASCAAAINAMVQNVLMPMGHFSLEHRRTAADVYADAIGVLSSVRKALVGGARKKTSY